jgi:hypothetical protein
MKIEQEQRSELLNSNAATSPGGAKGNISRGIAAQKSLRGGGGTRGLFSTSSDFASKSIDVGDKEDRVPEAATHVVSTTPKSFATPEPTRTNSGMFSRFLGNK